MVIMFFDLVPGRPSRQRRTSAGSRPSGRLNLEPLEERCLLSGDAVLTWNKIALNALQFDSTLGAKALQNSPNHSSRALAIVSAAVFDSVNSIERLYDPYMVQINAPSGASVDAAVAQAAHDTLVSLFPDYKSVLDADLATSMSKIHKGIPRNNGALVGEMVAAATLAARSHDGSQGAMPYTPGNLPGQWRPQPGQTAVGPLWGQVTPFGLTSGEQFEPPPPPALTSQAYAKAYMEVKNYGGDGITTPTLRTPAETQIGLFWGYDGSPGLGTPPVLYNQIAEVLAVQQHNSLMQNARFFALINIAMADAAIVCWDGKYDYSFWRPVAAIRENDPGTGPTGLGSGNPYLVG
jgi:hypothetical protein